MSSFNIAHLRDLIGRVQQASDPEIKFALGRLSRDVKQKLQESSSESTAFFDSVSHFLSQVRGTANGEVRVLCLVDCANYYYVVGVPLSGVIAASEAVSLARRIRDDRMLLKSLNVAGILLADAGSLAQAIEVQASAIELAWRLQDSVETATVLCNLGVSFMYAGQFHDALACFDSTLARIHGTPDEKLLAPRALANKASCFLYLNRISEGLASIQQSIDLSADSQSATAALSRTVRELNYVHLLLESGEKKKASERIPVIRHFAAKAGTARATGIRKIAEGLVEVEYGDVDRGLSLLCQVQQDSTAPITLKQDSLVALVRANEQLHRYNVALEYLQMLMAIVRNLRQDRALWHLRRSLEIDTIYATEVRDFTALERREAVLRARVAEDRVRRSQLEMLERLSVTADLREDSTGEHGYRVGRLVALFAQELGRAPENCLALELAARLHDIGKIGIPDHILLTSETLKRAERELMSAHTEIGAELLSKSDTSELRLAQDVAKFHHERWDGTGYPLRLAGGRIPLAARLVALADVFDALTHGRPYASPWPVTAAIEEITARSGSQFDPELAPRFGAFIQSLWKKHPDLDTFLASAARHSPFLQAREKIKNLLRMSEGEVERLRGES